jgi:hypothetical protein
MIIKMKPKPKIKKIKNSGAFLAYYESENGEKYQAVGLTFQDAIDKWYCNFREELKLGGG